jgi:hypothetical protein
VCGHRLANNAKARQPGSKTRYRESILVREGRQDAASRREENAAWTVLREIWKSRQRSVIRSPALCEFHPKIHRVFRFPGHGLSPRCPIRRHPCARSETSPMYPVCTVPRLSRLFAWKKSSRYRALEPGCRAFFLRVASRRRALEPGCRAFFLRVLFAWRRTALSDSRLSTQASGSAFAPFARSVGSARSDPSPHVRTRGASKDIFDER